MMLEAIGGLVLVLAAFTGLVLFYGRYRWEAGYEAHQLELKENRAARRREARTMPARGRHHLTVFPDREPSELLATTGELRELRELAEAGDLAELGRRNAAFWRVTSLREWTSRKASA